METQWKTFHCELFVMNNILTVYGFVKRFTDIIIIYIGLELSLYITHDSVVEDMNMINIYLWI